MARVATINREKLGELVILAHQGFTAPQMAVAVQMPSKWVRNTLKRYQIPYRKTR